MKRINLLAIIIINIFFVPIVYAKNDFMTFDYDVHVNNKSISNMIGQEDGYIFTDTIINDTVIYSYVKDQLKVSKQIENLVNTSIIKYNNGYLVVGVNANTLKIYFLDYNLQIKRQKDTSYFIEQNVDFKLYRYNENIFVMLMQNGNLASNWVYEIASDLDVKQNKFSSYRAMDIKNILHGDYYLIHHNDKINDSRVIHYNHSTYTMDYNVLVGYSKAVDYSLEKGYDMYAVLTIFDNEGKVVHFLDSRDYVDYKAVLLVNDKLVVLGEHKNGHFYTIFYDLTGNILDEVLISDQAVHNFSIAKVSNKIALIYDNTIGFYHYTSHIFNEKSLYGTVHVVEESVPGQLVTLDIVPNSGYGVEHVIVKDRQGNSVEVKDNTFVMPDNDVWVDVQYKGKVINPDTVDKIFLILGCFIIISFVTVKLYKRWNWLR